MHQVSERDDDLARPDEWIASVGRDHIIERDHVACAPLEAHRILFVKLADVVHDGVFNGRTVAVVHMSRQIFALEDRKQLLANVRIKAVHMVQLHLIEERHFAGHRML